jgi:hypothetical protein
MRVETKSSESAYQVVSFRFAPPLVWKRFLRDGYGSIPPIAQRSAARNRLQFERVFGKREVKQAAHRVFTCGFTFCFTSGVGYTRLRITIYWAATRKDKLSPGRDPAWGDPGL